MCDGSGCREAGLDAGSEEDEIRDFLQLTSDRGPRVMLFAFGESVLLQRLSVWRTCFVPPCSACIMATKHISGSSS